MSFEEEFEKFLNAQNQQASGQRAELLNREMTGERKMFEKVLWPVFQTFQGFVLEYEIVFGSGIKGYVDAFYEPLGLVFESEGYLVHAGEITRQIQL